MQTASIPATPTRIRHDLRFRDVQVSHVARISPGFIAVTFSDPSLHDFPSASFSDHIKLIITGADGTPIRRDYTPRRVDRQRGELTVEFALHAQGPACDWARQAQPGQRITIGGPKGSTLVPLELDWHLLAGDATALPAIHRRLEELPRDAHALVLVHLPDAADQRVFPCGPGVEVRWVRSAEDFLAALRAVQLPPGAGYAWCAGETALMAATRAILLGQHGLPRGQVQVSGYWKRGAVGFHEKFQA